MAQNRWSIVDIPLTLWVAATYLFLYVPLFVLTIFSFNNATFPYRWVGFTWGWYKELAQSSDILAATKNSLFVGILAVFFSLVLGLLFVIWSSKGKKQQLLSLFYPNLVIPEIVLAVSLLSFFVFLNVPLGLMTLVVAHTLLGLGYAIPIIHARYHALDPRLMEASLDLGATYQQTLFKVILPALMPALVSAGLLVFILSLDDFLLAFFCAGTSAQTLSLYIFAMIRSGVSPVVNALATVMLVVSSLLVVLFCSMQSKK
jgi:spermidine/putrescine transport system permease protein